jgi:hypothetical protein
MGVLRCPTTGRGFATGVNTDEATFKQTPNTISTARWRPSDARLLDFVPPSLWVENAGRPPKVAAA